MGFSNIPQLKEMAIAIQDFYYHPHTSTNTARDLKFTAHRCLSSKQDAENNPFATASIYSFPGNSRLGPLIKKKTGMQGKYPDTAVGGGITRNYAFMNEIIIANI
jgi:hypothetical protein